MQINDDTFFKLIDEICKGQDKTTSVPQSRVVMALSDERPEVRYLAAKVAERRGIQVVVTIGEVTVCSQKGV